MRPHDRGRTAPFVLAGVVAFAGAVLGPRLVYAASEPTAESALELLHTCPSSLRDRAHKRFMESLGQLRAVHLDRVLAIANGDGPLSCRGLAIISAGGIAARETSVVGRVVLALSPFLSHPDLWVAVIQGVTPIGAAANDALLPLLDAEDESTWEGVVIILQNINYSQLPVDSNLRSEGLPDTTDGRVQLAASWREWWRSAKQ